MYYSSGTSMHGIMGPPRGFHAEALLLRLDKPGSNP